MVGHLAGRGREFVVGFRRERPALIQNFFVVLQVFQGHPAGRVLVREQPGLGDQRGHARQGLVNVRTVGDFQRRPFRSPAFFGQGDGGGQGFLEPFAVSGHRGHGLEAGERFQAVDVDADALGSGLIHHVQRQNDGRAHFQHLHGKVKVALKHAGVDDIQHRAGTILGQHPAGHHFLQRIGGEGIGAGQVHQGDGFAVNKGGALFFFHSDAGIVADMLTSPGIPVEGSGFAGVGVAGNGDKVIRGGHAVSSACCLRADALMREIDCQYHL